MRAGKARQLDDWVAKGLISPEQRDAILQAEAPPPPPQAETPPREAVRSWLPFGRPDARELRMPLLGLGVAVAIAAVLMGVDVAFDDATDEEPFRVTPWAPLVAAGVLLGAASFAGKARPLYLAAGLAIGMLYFTLDVQHKPLSFVVSLLFVAVLPLLDLPPPVRIVAAVTAIPLVMLAGQRLGGTEPLAVQIALSAADLLLLAALLSGSAWRTVPYWGLVFLGAGSTAVALFAVAFNIDQGTPILDAALALAGSVLLLRLTFLWPRSKLDAYIRVKPPIAIPDLRRPPRLQDDAPLPGP